jgi:hypothetical protein
MWNHPTERTGIPATLYALIREVPGSNLGLATGFHVSGFRGIPRFLNINLCDICFITFRSTAASPGHSVLPCDAKILRELILHVRISAACFEDVENSYNKRCSDKNRSLSARKWRKNSQNHLYNVQTDEKSKQPTVYTATLASEN